MSRLGNRGVARRLVLAASAAVAISLGVPSAQAEWIVFDPTNFSQNVLTAARELQQIQNEMTSLQNEA